MRRPPDTLHAEAVQGCVGGPDDSAYECGAPGRAHGHTCACMPVSMTVTHMHDDQTRHKGLCCALTLLLLVQDEGHLQHSCPQ